ncbi:MAG: polyphosphate polymerase domain-containing protein [Bacteroidota bacterium]|nr:polyphosphate polymerase domain-containing protein [Bacteroidota bacterium]
MGTITDILNKFERVGLEDINSFKLMNRTDTKFTFSSANLVLFLNQLSGHYKVLSINNNLKLSYRTQYYDTLDFSMYFRHHNNALNRYKVRHRTYLESKTGFLEVKLKNNKGRTIKERIVQNALQNKWTEVENKFIADRTTYDPKTLIPSVLVKYTRITLINTTFIEKVTIDIDITFSNENRDHELGNVVIAEVKQAVKARTPALAVLKDLGIKPVSLSKYCLGVNYLYPSLKKNNFKQKLITLRKIINDAPNGHIAGI